MIVSEQIALWSPEWRLTSTSLHSWHYVKVNGCKNISLICFSHSAGCGCVHSHSRWPCVQCCFCPSLSCPMKFCSHSHTATICSGSMARSSMVQTHALMKNLSLLCTFGFCVYHIGLQRVNRVINIINYNFIRFSSSILSPNLNWNGNVFIPTRT